MLNFGQKVEERDNALIEKDSLLACVFVVRGIKNSRQTNGKYLDVELTVAPGQPGQGRKMWDAIADAYDTNNSQEYRDMGAGKIRRILEAVFGAKPDQPQSYTLGSYQQLDGIVVPVLVGIQKGKDGYEDKNTPEYLSPHSSVKKIVECYGLLQRGVHKYEKAIPTPKVNSFGDVNNLVGVTKAGGGAPVGPSWLGHGASVQSMQSSQTPSPGLYGVVLNTAPLAPGQASVGAAYASPAAQTFQPGKPAPAAFPNGGDPVPFELPK